MKKYIFNQYDIQLIVKAPNAFMATCYANQYLEGRYIFRFETHQATELDNDMNFGVIAAITGSSIEYFDSENKYYLKAQPTT